MTTMKDTTELVPLALLVAEGYAPTVNALARRLGDDVVIDAAGLRAVPIATARRLFDEREARRTAEVEARRLAASKPNPVIERVKAIQAHQDALRAAGLFDDDASALAVMCSADSAARLARKGRRLDELLAGRNEGLRIGPGRD
jgi:hypothetical protein